MWYTYVSGMYRAREESVTQSTSRLQGTSGRSKRNKICTNQPQIPYACERKGQGAKVTECARAARPPTHALPLGRPSNSLGPVWANMYSDPFSATTTAGVGFKNPVRVNWREIILSQEESAGRDIPMGLLVAKVLVSRESPLQPCQLWPGHNSPVPRR